MRNQSHALMDASAMKIIYGYVSILVAIIIASSNISTIAATSHTDTSTANLITVDQSGKGDFKKIQDAIDAVPSKNKDLVFILVKPGTYREKVVVPADKPFITLSGTLASKTIITWADGGANIFDSPTFTVLASDFVGRYLTIENTYGSGAQAVSLRVSGDRAAFYGCRILSYQDTLLDDTGSHYYSNCYIEGATDFICGNAASLFERCHLHSLSNGSGAITAQRRMSPSENTGFTFLGCKITGVRTAMLGRPWGTYSRVVYALTYISGVVLPEGWDDWGDESKQSTSYFGEYKNYGPGAGKSKRVEWTHILSAAEAAPFLTKDMIGGKSWLRPIPTKFKKGSTSIAVKADGKN